MTSESFFLFLLIIGIVMYVYFRQRQGKFILKNKLQESQSEIRTKNMYPSSNHPTMKALLHVILHNSIKTNSSSNAVFLEGERYTGFLLFCTERDHPGSLSERKAQQQERDTPNGFFFVGECRWLWSNDKKDIIGVTLRTDIEVGAGNSYGTEYDNQRRLEKQNRTEDVEWAQQKIYWLWEKTFQGKTMPEITLAEKWRVNSWDDYIDIGDYM